MENNLLLKRLEQVISELERDCRAKGLFKNPLKVKDVKDLYHSGVLLGRYMMAQEIYERLIIDEDDFDSKDWCYRMPEED